MSLLYLVVRDLAEAGDELGWNSSEVPRALRGRQVAAVHTRSYICTNVQDDLFQALADPTRRHLVEALAAGERAVGELVAEVHIDQSGVSRHLRILGKAGFVKVRPDGPRRFYSLRPEPFRELDAWAARYRSLWEARLDSLGKALERRTGARK